MNISVWTGVNLRRQVDRTAIDVTVGLGHTNQVNVVQDVRCLASKKDSLKTYKRNKVKKLSVKCHRYVIYRNKLTLAMCTLVCMGLWGYEAWKIGEMQEIQLSDEEVVSRASQNEQKLHILPIPRIKASDDISYEEFFRLSEHHPIIIEGAVKHHPAYHLDWEKLKTVCGSNLIEGMVDYSQNSSAFIGMHNPPSERIDEYIDEMFLHKKDGMKGFKAKKRRRYATGSSIHLTCPRIEQLMKVSKYVAYNVVDTWLLDKLEGVLDMPAIFFAPSGTWTDLHLDQPYHPIWMNVYIGAKRFRTLDFQQAYATFGDELNAMGRLTRKRKGTNYSLLNEKPVVGLEVFNPDFETWPELHNLTFYEGTVHAGDMLYMPPATMHSIAHDEDAMGISLQTIPIPHMELLVDVLVKTQSTDKEGERALMIQGKAGCLQEAGYNVKGLKPFTHAAFRPCLENNEVVQKTLDRLQNSKFKDMFLHELHGLPSSEEWCLNRRFYDNLEKRTGDADFVPTYTKDSPLAWENIKDKLNNPNDELFGPPGALLKRECGTGDAEFLSLVSQMKQLSLNSRTR